MHRHLHLYVKAPLSISFHLFSLSLSVYTYVIYICLCTHTVIQILKVKRERERERERERIIYQCLSVCQHPPRLRHIPMYMRSDLYLVGMFCKSPNICIMRVCFRQIWLWRTSRNPLHSLLFIVQLFCSTLYRPVHFICYVCPMSRIVQALVGICTYCKAPTRISMGRRIFHQWFYNLSYMVTNTW